MHKMNHATMVLKLTWKCDEPNYWLIKHGKIPELFREMFSGVDGISLNGGGRE